MKHIKRIVVAFVAIVVIAACGSVAFTGRKQLLVYSDSQITSLSEQSYTEFLTTAKMSTNRTQLAQVQAVGKRMTQALESYLKKVDQTNYLQGLNWDYTLVQSNEVNAFCMPSGKIVFYEGIMPYTNKPDFIAVVMGHEIAHAVARHGNERMSQEALVGTVGSVLNQMIAKNATQGTQALFDVAFGLGGQYGLLLPYSRKHEYEADKIGLIIMAIAGYDVDQAPVFWEKMSANSNGSSVPEFLSTHPTDANRIANLKKVIPEAKAYIGK
ncbi:MAG: M48 family metallopeptidase [Bacteroidales bacterium]|nr:M48 family metallopeptidase [Bacteroidales bacterium]MDD4670258.1 M48 family metallopeptidase [Bacteroidales bacterium]